jgi:endonuclease YncB( thermonuclease family)
MGDILPFHRAIKGKRRSILAAVALIGGAIGAASFVIPPHLSADAVTPGSQAASVYFSLCYTGGGTNCVVDGDTFWINGEKVRVADIDAPETHPSRCAREADLGNQATLRLQTLLNTGPVQLDTIDRDKDRYGRKLRIVVRNGQSLGAILVSEGLARRWDGTRHPWC